MIRVILGFLFILIFKLDTTAQSYKLELINSNLQRDLQLLGDFDSCNSFAVQSNSIVPIETKNWKKLKTTILPLVLTQQYNSHNPFGWNDGAMMKTKGYQGLIRPGINMRLGFFEAQAAPEFLFASNGSYPTNSFYGNSNNKSYNKVLLGQSFIKAHLGKISFGVSSENLWWGPGINSALLMSNNAPGFLHGFIATRKPIKTPIGSIEFNLIGAQLHSNIALGYENNHLKFRTVIDNWRYLNAFVLSFQPKWLPGLTLGLIRSSQQYGDQLTNTQSNFFSKYLPVISLPVQKNNNLEDDTAYRDQLASFFLRWVLLKSKLEFYVEYGKNDYGLNFRDYLMAPSHSVAYTIGFRKLIPKSSTKYIQLQTEITQMTQSPDYLVRDAGNWYTHWQIDQGYTHNNQVIGAGAGFGANIQTVSATWINGEIRNGFLIQRIERDPLSRVNKWTDFSIGWMPQWTYKNMILGAKVQLIRSNNYSWENGNHPFNLHSRLMVQYNFK